MQVVDEGTYHTYHFNMFEDRLRFGDAAVANLPKTATMNCQDFVWACLINSKVADAARLNKLLSWIRPSQVHGIPPWSNAILGAMYRRAFDGKEKPGDLVFFEDRASHIAHVAVLETTSPVPRIIGLGNSGFHAVSSVRLKHEERVPNHMASYVPFEVAAKTARAFLAACDAQPEPAFSQDTLWWTVMVQRLPLDVARSLSKTSAKRTPNAQEAAMLMRVRRANIESSPASAPVPRGTPQTLP
ncbi:MAG TPA: hypothetical protein VFH51_10905 [Myxococcota bacterium]|nr:hypothetical protein [Myxococcota bacterium]